MFEIFPFLAMTQVSLVHPIIVRKPCLLKLKHLRAMTTALHQLNQKGFKYCSTIVLASWPK